MDNDSYIKRMLSRLTDASDASLFCVYNGVQKQEISARKFVEDVSLSAAYFVENKIRTQKIALAASNSYQWITTYLAIIASGNIAVLLNQDLPQDILQWQCEKADVSFLCTDEEYLPSLSRSLPNITSILFSDLKSTQCISSKALYSQNSDDTVCIFFTSGTTGKSKAVEITSDNLYYSTVNFSDQYSIPQVNRVCVPVPFYHSFGLQNILACLYNIKTICIGRGVRYLFMDIPELKPDLLVAVPSIVESYVKLLKASDTESFYKQYCRHQLYGICFAGASLKESVLSYLLSKGLVMSVNYGMTEILAPAWSIIDDISRYRSAGKFTKTTHYRFVDNELLLTGPTLMKGYYKDAEETQSVIEDGWIHTGDLGYCDEDGYFYLTGRKKNVIILSNGENVNPEEIEAQFGNCESILECMVYADGKGICADVYSHNQEDSAIFIKKYNKSVPRYQQVYKINYTTTPLEKTGSGKIKRKANV